MTTRHKYPVRWARVAEQDLEAIIDYIALDNVDAAFAVLMRLRDRVATLSTEPLRGRVVPELQAQGVLSYRELIVKPWRIIYRESQQDVQVLALLDSRRNLEDILLERFGR
jgi:plasmid stabilization system protein ParE